MKPVFFFLATKSKRSKNMRGVLKHFFNILEGKDQVHPAYKNVVNVFSRNPKYFFVWILI